MEKSNYQGLPDLFGQPIRMFQSKNKKKNKAVRKNNIQNRQKIKDPELFDSENFFVNSVSSEERKRAQEKLHLAKIQSLASALNLELVFSSNNSVRPYIKHNLLADFTFEAREYSLAITNKLGESNGLIILPTGLGKTYVALNIMLRVLSQSNKKILFLAPTKPLTEQHLLSFKKLLPSIKSTSLTGHVPVQKRLSLWQENQIIVATPQTIISELKNEVVGQAKDLAMLVIDEVHHQTGNYAYVSLAKYYSQYSNIQLLGLTATPDLDIRKVKLWAKQLNVEIKNILVRSFNSPDVKEYSYYRQIVPHYLDRKLNFLQQEFELSLNKTLTSIFFRMNTLLSIDLSDYFYWNHNLAVGLKIKDFNLLRAAFVKGTKIETKRFKAYELLSLYGLAMLYNSALRSLHYGLSEFAHFLERQYSNLSQSKKKFQKQFCYDIAIQEMVKKLYFYHLWSGDFPMIINWSDKNKDWYSLASRMAFDDSKLSELKKILFKIESGSQVMIFTNYRDTLKKLEYFLTKNFPNKRIGIMTGTNSKFGDPGMSHQKQLASLKKFQQSKLDVLIATSVGEEGLDFPAVDVVVFYEPISNIRRYIQRLGRTARYHDGVVHILLYRDTEEEVIFYASRSYEKRLIKLIKYLSLI